VAKHALKDSICTSRSRSLALPTCKGCSINRPHSGRSRLCYDQHRWNRVMLARVGVLGYPCSRALLQHSETSRIGADRLYHLSMWMVFLNHQQDPN
jgi:hypothetical protein